VNNPNVRFIEVERDSDLRAKERRVTAAVKRLYPRCGPVKLYRTADGRIGFEARLGAVAGERKRLDEVYRTIMNVLGQRRGRRPGVKTIQTKLRLPEPVFVALKKAAQSSGDSVSTVVANLARQQLSV